MSQFINVSYKKKKFLLNVDNIGFVIHTENSPLDIIQTTDSGTYIFLNFGRDDGIPVDQTLEEVQQLIYRQS